MSRQSTVGSRHQIRQSRNRREQISIWGPSSNHHELDSAPKKWAFQSYLPPIFGDAHPPTCEKTHHGLTYVTCRCAGALKLQKIVRGMSEAENSRWG
jgi:hypothetical protein